MTITRNATLPAFGDLHRELNRLFENMAEDSGSKRTAWTPRADVVEYEDRFEILLDLPGIPRKELTIAFEGETLEVSGERSSEGKPEGCAYYRCERATGPFSREFRFPSLVSASGISATLQQGVLKVSVPKAEEAKARTIEIG